MSTTNTGWRSVKNDPPQASDFPIVTGAFYAEGEFLQSPQWVQAKRLDLAAFYTHWRSIKADPPSRELTQREKDEEALDKWYDDPNTERMMSRCWHAALAWEREVVEKDLIEAYGAFHHAALDTRTSAGFFRDFFRARREGGVTT
jgi:hypothetical protein